MAIGSPYKPARFENRSYIARGILPNFLIGAHVAIGGFSVLKGDRMDLQ